jgi:hypothetical protein
MNSLHPSLLTLRSFIKLQVLILFLLCISTTAVRSQEIDVAPLIEQKSISCREAIFTTSRLMQDYYYKQQADTLLGLIYYWEVNCGMHEPLMRFLILHMISSNTFYEDWYPEDIINKLEEYRKGPGQYYEDGLSYYQLHPNFNNFTRGVAEELRVLPDLTPIEKYFLEFYSGNFSVSDSILLSGAMNDSRFIEYYNVHQELIWQAPRNLVSFSGGLWMPFSNLKTLGSRPEFGVAWELHRRRILYNFYFGFAVGNPSTPYWVIYENELTETRRFLGFSAGADLGLEAWRGTRTSAFILPGIAYRGIEALNFTDENEPSKTISSFSPNVGFYVRHRFSRRPCGLDDKV